MTLIQHQGLATIYESFYEIPSSSNFDIHFDCKFVTPEDERRKSYKFAFLQQVVGSETQYFLPKVGIHKQQYTDWSAYQLRHNYHCTFAHIARLLAYKSESGARMAYNRYIARVVNQGTGGGYSYILGTGSRTPAMGIAARTFGVEIEFKGLELNYASRLIERATGSHCHITGYHGRTCDVCGQRLGYAEWKLERDSTVSESQEDEDGNPITVGGEAVSPVGKGDAHLEEIGKVMETLKRNGAIVNRQAGLHVHINMKDMGRVGLANFVLTWQQSEDFLYGLCAPSRRTNHYCEPMSLTEAQNIANQFRTTGRAYGNRGALNITSYPKLGTFEIRMHQGTLNPKKMKSWVKLLMAYTQAVKEGKHSDLTGDLSVLGKLTSYGFLDQEIGSYLFARHGHLAN